MGIIENVQRKRLQRESSERLCRIVASGKSHRDYEAALEILAQRERTSSPQASLGPATVRSTPPRADAIPLSTEVGAPKGCASRHRGQLVVERILGSSLRDGIVNDPGFVTVILAGEVMGALRPGWSTLDREEFPSAPPRGDLAYMPIRDMSVPGNPALFVGRVIALHRLWRKGRTIEVACWGGHGRTGMTLAILAALALDWPADEAVRRVRDLYCPRAVETEEQERFVEQAIRSARFTLASDTRA